MIEDLKLTDKQKDLIEDITNYPEVEKLYIDFGPLTKYFSLYVIYKSKKTGLITADSVIFKKDGKDIECFDDIDEKCLTNALDEMLPLVEEQNSQEPFERVVLYDSGGGGDQQLMVWIRENYYTYRMPKGFCPTCNRCLDCADRGYNPPQLTSDIHWVYKDNVNKECDHAGN